MERTTWLFFKKYTYEFMARVYKLCVLSLLQTISAFIKTVFNGKTYTCVKQFSINMYISKICNVPLLTLINFVAITKCRNIVSTWIKPESVCKCSCL